MLLYLRFSKKVLAMLKICNLTGIQFLFLIFFLLNNYGIGQDSEPKYNRVYVGVEPSLFLFGEFGGYVDFSINEDIILSSYFGWHKWRWNKSGIVQQYKLLAYSDYILASHGPVIRMGISFKDGGNQFRLISDYIKLEITYKYLSYDHVWFVNGSKGLSSSPDEQRSMRSHYYGANVLIHVRQFQSSFLDIPFDWFIGPNFGMGINNFTIHYPFDGNPQVGEPELNKKYSEKRFVYGVRVGIRLGVKVYDSEYH